MVWMESPVCPVPQDPQVSLVSLGFPDYQEQRETRECQESDFQDPQESKVSPGSQVNPDPQEDQDDPEWMVCPDSLGSLDPRGNLVSVCPVLLVYLESPALKVYLDQREIPVSLEALVYPDEVDLTAPQDLKVTLVCRVSLELVAHLDLPLSGHWVHQAHPDFLDQWDLQARKDSQEETEPRETLALQVWISQVCPEREDPLVSLVHLDLLEIQDPLEAQDGTACPVCKELKETWA